MNNDTSLDFYFPGASRLAEDYKWFMKGWYARGKLVE
jgi:hypothetical protein